MFRAQVIGPLLHRDFSHGELAAALRELSETPIRAPSGSLRTFSFSTLERWYYDFKRGGLEALSPRSRQAGFATQLSEEQRELLLAIRREHRSASVPLILRTLEADGRLASGAVSAPTVRRLYAAHGLDRARLRDSKTGTRLRWEASHPNALWHADVCHGPSLRTADGRTVPLRVHAILDDASRYIVQIAACVTEREAEMLALFVQAVRLYGKPDALYLDNGSTYIGDALGTACARLGIARLHARPRDPEARGKMERFFRTLRGGCLDFLGDVSSHHDVQVRLLAYLDRHYHVAPHASLLGRCPGDVFRDERTFSEVTEAELHTALVVRGRRRVRKDGTVSVAGTDFELDAGFLVGRIVTVARSLVNPTELPWVEHEDRRHTLRPVDPKINARRQRKRSTGKPRGIDAVPFDPPGALLEQALGRKPKPKPKPKDPS